MTGYVHSDGGDPIDELATLLAGLDRHTTLAAATTKRYESNRLALLYLHSLMAVLTAPLFSFHGWATGFRGASFQVVRMIPHPEITLPVVLGIGGLVLTLGTAAQARRVAIIGLSCVLCWYVTIATSIAYSTFIWLAKGAPLAPSSALPAGYAAVVYAAYTGMLIVHLRSLLLRRTRLDLL